MIARATTIAVTLLALLSGAVRAQSEDGPLKNVIMLSTRFSGDVESSQALTNLVRLQVSATFREAETGTRGRMVWSDDPIGSSTHEEAVTRGLGVTAAAQLVLWGDSYTLQDGIAVQPYISVTDLYWNRDGPGTYPPGVWVIPVPSDDEKEKKIALGMPRDFFRLPAVIYQPESTEPYPSLDGLTIYQDREFQTEIGKTGILYRALDYTADAVLLSSNGVQGWVKLDYLTKENNVAVKFAAALFRVTRGDYGGAEELLQEVWASPLDLEMEVNTILLLGLCAELRGESGGDYFNKAAAMAPVDASVIRYLLAGLIAEVGRNGVESESARMLASVLEANRPLFAPDSEWFRAVDQYVSAIVLK